MSSSPEHSLSDEELDNLMSTNTSLNDNKSLVLIIQGQLIEKENAVKAQQVALDLKDQRLKDCQSNLAEYDQKISKLEARIR